ncbi:B3 domain transcription factor [Quillaja saponaria]|uniref:B3 domain transcription factor n=1 Tax=Quillaja saponaria TaxID=32244 RepID=A0AAD7PYX5_QUISA|nr:B3 domain transcription factor [Quillaja saponaria]
MMMTEQEVVLQKNEACGLVAGVVEAGELGFVTVAGDTNTTSSKIKSGRGSGRIETRDLVAAISTFGGCTVHRKKRMARQRRSSTMINLLSLGFAASSTTQLRLRNPSTHPPAREIDHKRLRFLFQKELKNSDVSSLRRMILPKKAAETHLPVLDSKEGIFISMDDLDGLHAWSFKYRFWPNNNSRMYVLENTGEFVTTHGLQLGDSIIVYQDILNQNYVIKAKKATDEDEIIGVREDAVNDLVLDHDSDVNKSSSLTVSFPQLNDTGMSFIYDTTSLTDDSPLDFLGGPMTNYSRIRPVETFGSIENLSLDDFY